MDSTKRYSGEIFIERYCEKYGLDLNFSLLFSCRIEVEHSNIIKIWDINPYRLYDILSKMEKVHIYMDKDNTSYLLKGNILGKENRHIKALISQEEILKDRRRFHRFHFCCKDVGNFSIFKKGILISDNACIVELSKTGLRIINPNIGKVLKGDKIKIIGMDNSIEIEVEIIHVLPEGSFDFLGGKIIKSNENLISYIIKKYIKVSEKIVEESG